MKKNNKGLVIVALLAICVILTAGIYMLGQSPKSKDTPQDSSDTVKDVTPGEIYESAPAAVVPDIKPSEIPTPEPTVTEKKENDIPLTVTTDKPEPPELPDTAHTDEPDNEPTDPALTNPAVKPDSTPKPVEPTKPKETTPNSGDKNNKGEIYIPGFGWVKDEGGGGQGEKSGSDGDWDKIIGH